MSVYRVQDLKEQIATMTKEHKAAVQELNKTIKELNLSLEEQKAAMQKNRDIKIATEEALGNSQMQVEELKAKLHLFETTKANPGTWVINIFFKVICLSSHRVLKRSQG